MEATGWSPQFILTFVLATLSPIVALVGVWIGKALERQSSTNIARLQIHAQIDLTERLRWQDDFRTTLAHINEALVRILLLPFVPNEPVPDSWGEIFGTFSYHSTRLTLMLHPTKESQREVATIVAQLIRVTGNTQLYTPAEIKEKVQKATELKSQLLTAAATLLKEHWDGIQDLASKDLPTITEKGK